VLSILQAPILKSQLLAINATTSTTSNSISITLSTHAKQVQLRIVRPVNLIKIMDLLNAFNVSGDFTIIQIRHYVRIVPKN